FGASVLMLSGSKKGSEIMRDFVAARLKLLRTGKGLKQSEVAELIDCEPNTISRYERAETMPNIEDLLRLADLFGVSPMEILPPQDSTAQRIHMLRHNLTEKALQLETIEDLEQLIKLADSLRDKKK
ncbi:PbsX family transcriptional regulator, partial [Pseudomonas savastanoi pv. nerii]